MLLLSLKTSSIPICHVYGDSFAVPVYALKLRGIDQSYLKKLLK